MLLADDFLSTNLLFCRVSQQTRRPEENDKRFHAATALFFFFLFFQLIFAPVPNVRWP